MRGIERLLTILTTLGAGSSQSLSAVAESVDLPRPTTLRFLRSLQDGGWVTRDAEGLYSLGPAILALAGQYMSTDTLLVTITPMMRALRDELGETITLSRLAGDKRICVQEFPSAQSLRLVFGLGTQGPLHAGASGLILLSSLPETERDELLDRSLEVFTKQTIVSADALKRECDRIRETGWATTRGQRTAGAAAVAVRVRDPQAPGGVSALGVYGPQARCSKKDEQRWLRRLRECAESAEEALDSVISQ